MAKCNAGVKIHKNKQLVVDCVILMDVDEAFAVDDKCLVFCGGH